MKKFLLLIPIIIYIGASTWANFDLFPEGFMEYWWFDDLTHVLVFGAVTISFILITNKYTKPWWLGVCAAALLATLDEASQLFITARSFAAQDLVMSLVGIGLATGLYVLVRTLRQSLNRR